MLSEDDFLRLNAAERYLIEDLDPYDVVSFLKSHGVLNDHQINDLEHVAGDAGGRASKAAYLINLLRDCLPSLDILIEALHEACYDWLVEFLKNVKIGSGQHILEPKFTGSSSTTNIHQTVSVRPDIYCQQNGHCPKDINANHDSIARSEPTVNYSAHSLYTNKPNHFALASKGKIPKRPDVYVHRGELFERLKELVSRLQHQSGWVVLHGMGGSGKSVLAAEVARDHSVLGSMFPQIFWIPFDRPLSSMSLEMGSNPHGFQLSRSRDEKAVLLSKLLHLYGHVAATALRKDTFLSQTPIEPFTDVEQGLQILPDLLLKHYPRTLLVLDDVWSAYHVKKFEELSCRYLMTTRDESIIYCINAYKEVMPMNPSGFTRRETMEALGKWLRCPAENLPDLALSFFEETDGHPFFISLIGSLLKSHRNRWTYYYNEIRRNSLETIKSQTSVSSYAHRSFTESIAPSVAELSENLKQKYIKLATFPLKSCISARVLSVYWNMDMHKVEDLMDQFVLRNLVTKEFDDRLDCDTYTLHNLLHRFLQTFLDEASMEENHRELITNYQAASKGNWAVLQKDGYIHKYIGYHLLGAGLGSLFPDVFLNMKFLYDKSLLASYQSILNDFATYGSFIRQNHEETFDEFDRFLKNHAQRCLNPSPHSESSNLLHLALEEPHDSCIYKNAIIYV